MKQKDIIIIVTVTFVTAIFSYVLASYIFGGEKAYKLKAPTVDAIVSEFTIPSQQYFNKQSLNPTKDITIGDTTNPIPFNNQ